MQRVRQSRQKVKAYGISIICIPNCVNVTDEEKTHCEKNVFRSFLLDLIVTFRWITVWFNTAVLYLYREIFLDQKT